MGSMSKEEAATMIETMIAWYSFNGREAEALGMGVEALRPVSRERMKKMRGEWMGSADGYADGELVYDIWECSRCGYVIDEEDDPDMLPQFCPKCCSIMTDEALEMVMERFEALNEKD